MGWHRKDAAQAFVLEFKHAKGFVEPLTLNRSKTATRRTGGRRFDGFANLRPASPNACHRPFFIRKVGKRWTGPI
jgi:hypothetical protein